MRNIELKVPVTDLAAVRALLPGLGAVPAGLLWQVDTYFLVPNGRLKLREAETAELIAYSRPDDVGARVSEYLLAPVAAPGPLKEALARALGIRVVVGKRRELW